MKRTFLPAKPAPFLPGKQVATDWRQVKIQEQAREALAATDELETRAVRADAKIRSIEDVVWPTPRL